MYQQRLFRFAFVASLVLSTVFPSALHPFTLSSQYVGQTAQAATLNASPKTDKQPDLHSQSGGLRNAAIRGSTAGKAGARNQHTHTARPRVVHYERAAAGAAQADQQAVYIVLLQDAPVATYRGGIAGLAPTSPAATNARRLDPRSGDVSAYRAHLSNARSSFRARAESTLGRAIRVLYEYDTVLNGVAMQLTPVEAAKLLDLEEVQSIQRDQWRYALTNDSPTFLGVPGIWDGSATAGLPGTKGEGVIVGVIDSGIWPEHPSFADDGSFPAPPAEWSGGCSAPSDNSLPYTCSNKLIGVQHFIDGYVAASGGTYDGLFYSGRDDDGHGTHTASTAAGNENVAASIYGLNYGAVSGMAPQAHVASYKGLGPFGGVTSDLSAAIEQAVLDGVDVINYSVGSNVATDPWLDADALAYLAAREAGVFVATSAGNAGPGVSTIGSPANAPWIMSVGASYFNRLYLSDISVSGPGTPPTGLYGASSTRGVENFRLVDAEGTPTEFGETDGRCNSPFASGTFAATDVVLCESGDIATWAKADHVRSGGAGAMIVYNDVASYDLNSYLYAIPALRVLHETGLTLKDYVANNPGQVQLSFTQGQHITAPDPRVPVDTVVGFSSRGPAINANLNQLINVLKPDITAPGIHILAGASPEHVTEVNGLVEPYGAQGQLFQLIQGTSMSSPHVAGLGALMRGLHPDWSPAQIQSALMTTANSAHQARTPEGDGAATPFDMGAGRADMTQAGRAGFVLDENATNYRSADPLAGGNPAALNIASLTDGNCISQCSWTRVIQSSWSQPVEWTLSTSSATTITLTAEPAAFTLAPGASQTITVAANVPAQSIDKWFFGELLFTPTNPDVAPAHFPVAVRSSAGESPTRVAIETRRDQGRYAIEDIETIAVEELTVQIYSDEPQLSELELALDPTNEDPYDFAAGGLYSTTIAVAETAKQLVIETKNSTAPDLDLYVGIDTNGNGTPEADEELCRSTSGSADEICDFRLSDGTLIPGVYWIVVQNWSGSGADTDSFTLSTLLIDDSDTGPLSASGPASVTAGEPFDLHIGWNIPGFAPGEQRYGVLELVDAQSGASMSTIGITLQRLEDDVALSSDSQGPLRPGDVVSYTINVQPEPTVQEDLVSYILTNTIPAGMSYVADSASVAPTSINGNVLTWQLDVTKMRQYVMSTSLENPLCDTGFGGYVDLVEFGILANPQIVGSGNSYRFDDFYGDVEPVTYFGEVYSQGLYFTDDGFAHFDTFLGEDPGVNTALPNPTLPNNLVAALWRDLEVVYDEATNRGVSIAGAGSLMLVEYDGVEPAPAGSSDEQYTFELLMDRFVNDSPGFYEIVFAYRGAEGAVAPATIGLENADGSQGVQYAYNDAVLQEGLMICFDWTLPEFSLTYQAQVNADLSVPATLTNTVQHIVDAPGYGVDVAELALDAPDVILEISMTGPDSVAPGEPISYTFTVTNSSTGTAPAVVITTDLPAATTLVSGGVVTDGVVSIELGDLPGNSSRSVQMAVLPTPPNVQSASAPAQAASPHGPTIVGGGEAEPGAWPWQVAIMFADIEDGFLAQFCGGTLIAPTWVLTAGHCVTESDGSIALPGSLDVAVGRHTLSSNEGERVAISQIVRHPDYVETAYNVDYDLALIRLASAVVLSETVGLIAPLSPAQAELARPHIAAAVIGWGAQNDPDSDPFVGPNYADALRETTVPIVSNEICGEAYDAYYGVSGVITESMVCAGFREGGKDACYGDSGGPLMVWDDASGWLQAGIVSGGIGCAQPNYYGIYTRVTSFYEWINGDGRNTYVTSGKFQAIDAEGHSAVGFNVISTVVRTDTAPPEAAYEIQLLPDSASSLHAQLGALDIQLEMITGTVSQPISLTLRTTDAPPAPNGFDIVAAPFAIEAFNVADGTPLADFSFDRAIEATVAYNAEIGGMEGAANVTLQYYDEVLADWMLLPAAVDIKTNTLTASLSHSGIYAVMRASPTALNEQGEPLLDQRVFLPLIDLE